MFKYWLAIVFSAGSLLGACELDPKPETPPAKDQSTSVTAVASTSVSPEASTTVVLTPRPTAAPAALPPPPEEVAKIRIKDPEGVDFVRQHKWRVQEPNWDMLKRMPHASNAPVLDIVIMHSAVLTTADDEEDILRNIMAAHMNPSTGRGWGDISAHYLVGPSGKVYQGRLIWYRVDGTVGAGMGRFSDPWGKCAIMLLGDFNNPAQVFTPEAQSALKTLIDDRKDRFERLYEDELKIREAETRAMMGKEGPFGLDEVRVRKHPSLPMAIQTFLNEGGNASTAGDGGTKP